MTDNVNTLVNVTLVYADGTTWFAGSFQDEAAAQAWVAVEKTRPYWVSTTQAQIEPVPAPSGT